tara:strand:+ start:1048 stop:1755 length:708 start_codon:yes stop_codon:yes gene_type:complete
MSSHDGTYTREFEAKVTATYPEIVELEKTAFYPLGGGQPSDKGIMEWDNQKVEVFDVRKKNRIRHMVKGNIPDVGTTVKGTLDWNRRYSHMKMHTSQHLVSAVVNEIYKSDTVGNQIGEEKSRIDFKPLKLDKDQISEVEAKVNDYISEDLEVNISEELRSNLENNPDIRSSMSSGLWKMLPKSVTKLRIVTIGDIDVCPCAGTHVKSLKEIGKVSFVKKDNKGSKKQRLTYVLD